MVLLVFFSFFVFVFVTLCVKSQGWNKSPGSYFLKRELSLAFCRALN